MFKCKLVASEQKQRSLVASSFITKGDLILENVPVALARVSQELCSYCLSYASTSLACFACRRANYCSRTCQLNDAAHKIMCGLGLVDPALEMLVKVFASPEASEFLQLCSHPLTNIPPEFMDAACKLSGREVREVERMLSIFKCNNFTVWNSELEAVCDGAYLYGSLINHSCVPSAYVLSFQLR
jgi:hypothetical protein